MADKRALDYVRDNLSKGFTVAQVKSSLLNAGWDSKTVEEAMKVATTEKKADNQPAFRSLVNDNKDKNPQKGPFNAQQNVQATSNTSETKKGGAIYYLLPILLGIIGGIIGFIILKDDDQAFAKKLLIIGIVVTAITVIIGIVLPMLFLASMFTGL